MNVTVVGGGNLGSLLAANISLAEDSKVTLLTNSPDKFSGVLQVIDEESGETFFSNPIGITDSFPDALAGADMVLCTLPSFLRNEFSLKAEKHLSSHAQVGFVPGSGGVEFACMNLIRKGIAIFGMQRVPYICRMQEYGKICLCKSIKKEIHVASIPNTQTLNICKHLESLLGIKTIALQNYLAVTLTPSNPILHTSRLYSLFKDYAEGITYDNIPLFYHEWTDDASRVLINCDNELQTFCKLENNPDLSEVKSLLEHYEADSAEGITKKLRSIPAFENLYAPMVQVQNGFTPDWSSRYFTEDYPYGLAIIKGFSVLAGLFTPYIDASLFWYQDIRKETYFMPDDTVGKDISMCGAPQKYGYNSLEDVIEIYR